MLCYRVRSPQPSAVLELLSQVGDAARRIAGVLACLSQGIGAHEEDAGLLVVFASDAQVAAFCSDQQVRTRCAIPRRRAALAHAYRQQLCGA